MTRASVIIPSHRGAKRLPIVLDALAHQTHADMDVIVVIDGDIDGSTGVVGLYADRLPVRALVLPHNQGRVTALNTGLAEADGDVLIRCDDDFEPAPGHIAAHVAAHAGRYCGAVGLPLNVAPDSAYMRAYGHQAEEVGRQASYAVPPHERWRIFGGNTSISRAVYETVGEFDVRYRGYGWEDLDYGYRIQQAGYPIALVPDAEVRHHMASVTTAIRAERAYRSGAARRTFEVIHGMGSSGPPPSRDSLWNRLVGELASTLTLQRTRHAGHIVDALLPFAPTPVGRKAVAAVVEAATRAGFSKGLLDVD